MGQPILLPFPPGCVVARFLRREKRFRVEVERNGQRFWVHTNNSGSMMGMVRPGREVLLSPAANPGRKLAWTLEAVRQEAGWVGANTSLPNRLLLAGWRAGLLPELAAATGCLPEARVGDSRLDALFTGGCGPVYVEAKNVTLVVEDTAWFPDAPTERGRKHLRELIRLAGAGIRVAVFACIPHPEARCFAPARLIDPEFADLLTQARAAGVEIWPQQVTVTPAGVAWGQRLPLAACAE